MAQLEGKVAVVTGGGRGLGRAYCEALAREGAAVVAADIRDTAETVDAIGKTNGRVTGIALDAAEMASCETMAKHAVAEFGRIDVLINNAALYGDIQGGRFEKIPQDEWDKTMAVNVRGVWQCTKACVPAMREAGGGSIVNIASLARGLRHALWPALRDLEVRGDRHDPRARPRTRARLDQGQRHRAERRADRGGPTSSSERRRTSCSRPSPPARACRRTSRPTIWWAPCSTSPPTRANWSPARP